MARTVSSPAAALPPAPQIVDQLPPDDLPEANNWGADYVDIQPDWRLHVTVPLLKSGGYQLKTTDPQVNGNTITLAANGDLEGYETDFYSVQPREGGGVRIEFASSVATKNGQAAPQSRPSLVLFELPPSAKFVRLLYSLQRGREQSDHGMAILAADEMSALEAHTLDLQKGRSRCESDEHKFCYWIPTGIAVVPEVRKKGSGADFWEPAR
jgi:hypothetical protein